MLWWHFCDFRQFRQNIGVFLKKTMLWSKCCIICLCFESKTPFFCWIFRRKYFKTHIIGPWLTYVFPHNVTIWARKFPQTLAEIPFDDYLDSSGSFLFSIPLRSRPGLPDCTLVNQKYQFWYIWVELGQKNVGLFRDILLVLMPFCTFQSHLVHFVVSWYIFPFWYVVPRKISVNHLVFPKYLRGRLAATSLQIIIYFYGCLSISEL
jgi:hypothetical protein